MMRFTPLAVAVLVSAALAPLPAQRSGSSDSLFVWAGDADRQSADFLAVIDVRPALPRYGAIVTTLPVGAGRTGPHHTEHEMPAGGVLFANGFGSGQTFRIDLRQPRRPRLLGSFGAAGEFMHPHSYARLPDGSVLATYQMRGHDNAQPGALVHLDPEGRVLRVADAADPAADRFIRPYSLAVVPAIDRVVTSSADMHAKEVSRVVQVWRLSDLKLIKSVRLPAGLDGEESVDSAEPRVLTDGRTVLVSTFDCGLYRMTRLDTESPGAEFVHSFRSGDCALPVVAGSFWVQADSKGRALVSLDVSNPAAPLEVSRLTLGPGQFPHWIAIEPSGDRIVISGGDGALRSRVLMAAIDRATGALRLDERFREDGASEPGIRFDRLRWPHGESGDAIPHGAVFSRR